MMLDRAVCERARLSRDPRFDGKFFIGVSGSGVYCRPICPAPTAQERNCRYYPTAAAAAEAGYRPCLRCRPECSPGTPAWLGTPATVTRALRLIAESGLEHGGVEWLAQRLGVGSRHLRRLFLRYLGATPKAVAQTSRLQFAKKLIDETTLPMTQVALAAGFGSVRRFNAAIRQVYHRTPTHLRTITRRSKVHAQNEYVFRLRFRPPYDWDGVLRYLAARLTPGIESIQSIDSIDGIQAQTYRRTIILDGRHGAFEVTHDPRVESLVVRVQFPDPRALYAITERIRSMFDLSADWSTIRKALHPDPVLGKLAMSQRGMRIAGCWDGFELTVCSVLAQPAGNRGGFSLAAQLVKTFGEAVDAGGGLTHLFPSPAALASADLARIGLSGARAQTIRSLACAVRDGKINFQGIGDTEQFLQNLQQVTGIGDWMAQYVAMRALGEPDAFPLGDSALQHQLGVRNAAELECRSIAWRPWRAYAAMYLWRRAEQEAQRVEQYPAA